MNMPRVVIGGTHSGVGKTTLATGIMAALKNQGLRVQGFKVGPDYIDPGYHRLATGTMSRNLDCWMLGEDRLLQSFTGAAESADISVVEGVMGLFDGAREDGAGSTAHVARLLQAPVILVVDVKSMGQSAAAVVYGYQHLWPDLNIKGVIINKVASEKHYAMVRESIEKKCNIPVIGAVYRDAALATPERHLGLLPVAEHDEVDEKISRLGENIAAAVDLAELITIARSAPSLTSPYRQKILNNFEVSLAVARDEAFNFYYQDGLDLLTAMGAKLKFLAL